MVERSTVQVARPARRAAWRMSCSLVRKAWLVALVSVMSCTTEMKKSGSPRSSRMSATVSLTQTMWPSRWK